MLQQKDSFIFYRSFYESIRGLDDKKRLKMYDAIANFALNNEENDKLDNVCKSFFILMKPQIVANNKRYVNGLKGGRPSKKITDGFLITEPNENENENGNEKENENLSFNENGENITPTLDLTKRKKETNKNSLETIEEELFSICDKKSAAKVLLRYYERGEYPPSEFNPICEYYNLDSYAKLVKYAKELKVSKT